jgi:hypothetical protein
VPKLHVLEDRFTLCRRNQRRLQRCLDLTENCKKKITYEDHQQVGTVPCFGDAETKGMDHDFQQTDLTRARGGGVPSDLDQTDHVRRHVRRALECL